MSPGGAGVRRYAELAVAPSVLRVALPSVLARLPLGMTTLALLLEVHQSSGSFGLAGGTTALFALGNGVSSPVRGRLVDRLGAAPVLVATGLLHPVALLALVAATRRTGLEFGVLAAAATAGFVLPPVGPIVRAVWQRLPDRGLRESAFSLDAVIMQAIFYAVGPPAVTLLSVVASPSLALYVIAALTFCGALTVASAPAVQAWPVPQHRPALLGALAVPGLPMVLLIAVTSTTAIGAVEVAVTAFAAEHTVGDYSGVLLAALGLGSVTGGLFHGTRTWRPSLAAQYRWWLGALAVGLVPLGAAPGPASLGWLLFVAGLAIGPASTVQFSLIGALAPSGSLTEAFTWLVSASFAGNALGNAVGGSVAQIGGARAALLLSAAVSVCAVVLSVLGCARLDRALSYEN